MNRKEDPAEIKKCKKKLKKVEVFEIFSIYIDKGKSRTERKGEVE